MNIVNIDPKNKKKQSRKSEMLEVLEELKTQIENDEIEEFVACSQGKNGLQIHASCLDAVGGIGMFEVGKQLLIDHEIKS
jgi:CCR4-NOT transcriptional regulation complex NOT5 subunit